MFLVKVPGVNGTMTEGCKNSGNYVIESLKKIHSTEAGNVVDTSLLDLEEIHVDDSQPTRKNELIYQNALEIFETKTKAIFLGGDHSISFSLGKALLDHCNHLGSEPCLIAFDAHAGCMLGNQENPTNRSWLRSLIDSGFPPGNVLLVGVRNSSPEELAFLSKYNVRRISMNQLLENLEDRCDGIMEFSNGKELYFSLDVDVLDAAFVPGTPNPEPGGLTSRELFYLIQRINKTKRLRAVDIVEINVDKDRNYDGITTKLGAKIVAEFL